MNTISLILVILMACGTKNSTCAMPSSTPPTTATPQVKTESKCKVASTSKKDSLREGADMYIALHVLAMRAQMDEDDKKTWRVWVKQGVSF